MNKKLLTLFCATSLMTGALAANAQEADRMPPPPAPGHEEMMPKEHFQKMHQKMLKHQEKMDKKLADDLKLTEEQQEQAKKIREEGREKMKPLMEKMKALRGEMDKVRRDNMADFEKILTLEQKAQFDKIKADRKAHIEKKMKKGDKKFDKKIKHGGEHEKKAHE